MIEGSLEESVKHKRYGNKSIPLSEQKSVDILQEKFYNHLLPLMTI